MLVSYNGSQIDSKYFRAYVYHADGRKLLADSWDRHQELLETGEWFTSRPEKPEPTPQVKRSTRKRK